MVYYLLRLNHFNPNNDASSLKLNQNASSESVGSGSKKGTISPTASTSTPAKIGTQMASERSFIYRKKNARITTPISIIDAYW